MFLAASEVEQTLDRYGEMIRREMRSWLQRQDGNPRLEGLMADYPNRAGKALRPAILLATCQAFGGSSYEALGAAVSIELLHNAFLIHDDIEDDSELRRGEPTLHRLHGVPLALNAGDALAVLALEPLHRDETLGSRLAHRLSEEFLQMARRTIDGQATELGWRRDVTIDLTPDDYLELVGHKTCWYTTIYPLRAGAMIGTRGTGQLIDLNRFGFFLGAAFQIRDDLLDILGSADVFGKKPYGDVREGKRTLMLIHLLQHTEGDDRHELIDFLSRDISQRSDDYVDHVVQMMRDHGSIDAAIEYGRGIGAVTYDAFEVAFRTVPESAHRDFLHGLVAYMLERNV